MPEVNYVDFRYEPVPGDLYFDSFRSVFFTERGRDVRETLQYLCFAFDVVREIEGTIKFVDAEGEPPKIQGVMHPASADTDDRQPFPEKNVTLWPDD